MNRIIVALILAMGLSTAGSAFAKSCSVVGTWKDANYGETFTMSTNKAGTAGANPECSNEASKIKTTALSKSVWDFTITSKKCTVVISANFNFDTGSCTAASGSITIPGVGTLPDTISKTAAVRHQPAPSTALTNGLR